MKEEWLFPGAIVSVDVETTSALVVEIKRLIDVVGGMALAQPKQQAEPVCPECKASVLYECVACSSNNYPSQPEQSEPAAKYIGECSDGSLVHLYDDVKKGAYFYTNPPKRTWVGSDDLEDSNAYLTPPQPEQKRPQNCGTGYCSCIECVMKPSPRAWLIEFENGDEELHFDEQSVGEIHVPLYTDPPQRTWVDLTDEEIQAVAKQARSKDHAVTLTNQFLRGKNT